MKKFRLSILAAAAAAALFAAGVLAPMAGEALEEGPAVCYFLEDLIEGT